MPINEPMDSQVRNRIIRMLSGLMLFIICVGMAVVLKAGKYEVWEKVLLMGSLLFCGANYYCMIKSTISNEAELAKKLGNAFWVFLGFSYLAVGLLFFYFGYGFIGALLLFTFIFNPVLHHVLIVSPIFNILEIFFW